MAYFEFNHTAAQSQNLRQLKQAIVNVNALAILLNEQLSEMTDEQKQSQFGVPVGIETAFTNNIAALVTLMDNAAIQQILAQMGFTA